MAIEDYILQKVIDEEYTISKTNNQSFVNDFDSWIDLFDSDGVDRKYDWMSNITIPEFTSLALTQSSIDASQAFVSRDFTDVYLEDNNDEAQKIAAAIKELLNRVLNQKDLHYYQKYMRAKTLNNITGRVYLVCYWEKRVERRLVGTKEKVVTLDVDIDGEPILSDEQIPAVDVISEDIFDDVVVVDRFNFDVIDSRNVFTSNEYTYTVQDKGFVIIMDEISLSELEDIADEMGYFGLDRLKEVSPDIETDTSRDSYNKQDRETKVNNNKFDRLTRYGKFLTKDGKVGIDNDGNPLDGAKLEEVVITIIMVGGKSYFIGFHPTPYINSNGNPYRPVIRGLCYIHPTDDGGFGDGKHSRDLSVGINDTLNVSHDRSMLATIPTLKGMKGSIEDNPDIYFEPGHVIPLNAMDELSEFRWDDNTLAALTQAKFYSDKMQQVNSIYPTTMGQLPALSSTTATAIAGAEQRSNTRSNYKSLTFEHTVLTELYWMIIQMVWQFASIETAHKLMGDKVVDFNPQKEYYFKPITQSIESEYSKLSKAQKWIQVLGMISKLQNPNTVVMLNYIFKRIAELLGDEYSNFANVFLNPLDIQGQDKGLSETNEPLSNQSMIPQSMLEQFVRGGGNEK